MNWSTTIVVKEPLHTLLTNVNKMEGGHRDRSLRCNLTLYTLKDQGNYGVVINKTGICLIFYLQNILFCCNLKYEEKNKSKYIFAVLK